MDVCSRQSLSTKLLAPNFKFEVIYLTSSASSEEINFNNKNTLGKSLLSEKSIFTELSPRQEHRYLWRSCHLSHLSIFNNSLKVLFFPLLVLITRFVFLFFFARQQRTLKILMIGMMISAGAFIDFQFSCALYFERRTPSDGANNASDKIISPSVYSGSDVSWYCSWTVNNRAAHTIVCKDQSRNYHFTRKV